ncbi:hypothetical protein JQ628_10500 [Bradyrhizobium lablabi]|uniref:hypothetical protein n=1 Tax=Bradyrhizobium lablabi TaxID=722472 RepID=UPI001BAE3ACB|nr:hypothetical protein [Bradyrhizobium lablabi]MBR1121942.1 hypothetical protein [Bradyrhizobium lablabi]
MKFRHLAVALVLLTASAAYAHNPKSAHGGRIVLAGAFHAELVVKDKAIEVFLRGHDDKPIDPKGFKGVAILNVGGKAERITLAPSEKQALSGTAAGALPENPKGAVQFTAPDGTTSTARFD